MIDHWLSSWAQINNSRYESDSGFGYALDLDPGVLIE